MTTPPQPKKRKRTGDILRHRGFDLSRYDRSDRNWTVKCSQCEALCVNGIPTHETGCPNTKWKK